MCDKASQIFSLKSNLISQIKGGSINLHNQKINQHIRLRSVCFSNVLQTIRKEAAKGKEQIKNQIQREKENQGIFVEAYNFKGGDDEGRGRQSAKVAGLGSRSFLIRSCNMRKNNNTNTNKPQQKKPQNLCLCVSLQKYSINNLRQLTKKTKYRLRNKYNNSPTLMLIIPQYMFCQPPSSSLLQLMQLMILNQIQIFVAIVDKKQDRNNISHVLQTYSQFCNFVYLRQLVDNQKEHFIDLADLIQFQSNITNVVTFVGVSGFANWFVVPYLNHNNYDQHHPSHIYQQADDGISFDSFGTEHDPYYKIFETIQDRQPDKSIKIAFLKTLSLETIKNISITGSLVKIEVRNSSRKLRITQCEYPLRQQVKLLCSLVSQGQIRSYRQLLPLEPLQDKLIQYTKVLKTQKQQSSKSPAPSPSICTGTVQNKIKQYRRSLTSKSPYQLINELIRNNQHIHKQINQYIQHSNTMPIFNDIIQCDNVRIYVLE